MIKPRPEPVQVIKQRRDEALGALVSSIPYIQFLGVSFDRRGDELTAIMRYSDKLIGNPGLPALHGGAIAAFLEISAVIELSWSSLWKEIEIQAAREEIKKTSKKDLEEAKLRVFSKLLNSIK